MELFGRRFEGVSLVFLIIGFVWLFLDDFRSWAIAYLFLAILWSEKAK